MRAVPAGPGRLRRSRRWPRRRPARRVDAEEHLDAVRDLGIWRLPTLLVVDRRGNIAQRTVGVPDRASLRATVTEVLAA